MSKNKLYFLCLTKYSFPFSFFLMLPYIGKHGKLSLHNIFHRNKHTVKYSFFTCNHLDEIISNCLLLFY